MPVAESGLPSGGPTDKGLPVDPSIPGSSTFNKKVDDVRDFDRSTDTPNYRRDNPDDQLKKRDRIDTREDNAEKHDGIGEMGKGKWDTTVKTKYPYRDGLPHQHYASAREVVELWKLQYAHTARIVAGGRVKVAARPEQILKGLNPKFQQKAAQCSVTLKRADRAHLRWIFAVDCGHGAKMVKIKASRGKNVVRFVRMDMDLSCSCPAWRWLGPEHHAKREKYLDGNPRGTASVPVIRDPQGINRVCKHVAAVLSFTKDWEVPK